MVTVILLKEDEAKEVKDGYARNYLIPYKLAILATPKALAQLEERRKKRAEEEAAKREELKQLAEKLSALDIVITAEAGTSKKLFGAVTSDDIAVEISKLSGIEIDKKKIELEEPIKKLGNYEVPLKLSSDVTAKLKIRIEKTPQ